MGLQLVLDRGYAVGRDVREEDIAFMVLRNVRCIESRGGAVTVTFMSPEAAREARDRTGWVCEQEERTLIMQTAGDHVVTRPPEYSDADHAFYERWFVQPGAPRWTRNDSATCGIYQCRVFSEGL